MEMNPRETNPVSSAQNGRTIQLRTTHLLSLPGWLKAAFLLLRISIAGLLVLFFREAFVDILETYIGIEQIVPEFAYQLGFYSARLTFAVVCFCTLFSATLMLRNHKWGWLLIGVLVFLSMGVLLRLTGRALWLAIPAALGIVASANTLPTAILDDFFRKRPRMSNLIGFLGIASCILLMRPFLRWSLGPSQTASKHQTTDSKWLWAVPAILVSLLAGAALGPRYTSNVQSVLRGSPAVLKIANENFNWLELDTKNKRVYATGHGLKRVRSYDLNDLNKPPIESDVETFGTQSFTLDLLSNELYFFNSQQQKLVVLDASTLRSIRTLALPRIATGDLFLAVDAATDSIAIASEADEQNGAPFLLVDRKTGAVRQSLPIAAGNLLHHPTKPWIYMSFFRFSSELLLYDMQQQKIIKRNPTDKRVDRLAFSNKRNELLLSSPLQSSALRIDPESLETIGRVSTQFGGRTLAVDEDRDLYVSASLLTGELAVLQPNGNRLRNYYLSPWLRSVVLDTSTGNAYVSSQSGLFRVKYME